MSPVLVALCDLDGQMISSNSQAFLRIVQAFRRLTAGSCLNAAEIVRPTGSRRADRDEALVRSPSENASRGFHRRRRMIVSCASRCSPLLRRRDKLNALPR